MPRTINIPRLRRCEDDGERRQSPGPIGVVPVWPIPRGIYDCKFSSIIFSAIDRFAWVQSKGVDLLV